MSTFTLKFKLLTFEHAHTQIVKFLVFMEGNVNICALNYYLTTKDCPIDRSNLHKGLTSNKEKKTFKIVKGYKVDKSETFRFLFHSSDYAFYCFSFYFQSNWNKQSRPLQCT